MKIAAKIMRVAVITVIVMAVSLSLFVYYFQSKALETETRSDMARLAERLFDMVNMFLYERRGDIKLFAFSLALTSGNYSQSDTTKRFIEYRDFYKCYDSLAVYDLERKCIVDTTGLNIGKEDALDGYCLDPLIDKDMVIYASYSSTLNMPILYFTCPVKNSEGKVFEIAVSRIPISKIGEILKVRTEYSFGKLLDLDLIDKNGTLLYSTHDSKDVLKGKTCYWSDIESRIKSEAQGASFFFEEKGKNIVFVLPQPSYLDFQKQGWYLALHIPLEKALAPAMHLRNQLIIITSIFIFPTCIIAFMLSRIISSPIKMLRIASERFAKGDMDYRVSIKSGDEIEDLAGSFNKMAENIKGKEAEILKENAYAEGIISSMIDTLIVINPDETIRSVNKATLDFLLLNTFSTTIFIKLSSKLINPETFNSPYF